MAKTIQQSAVLKAKPAKVFALYADAKKHTAVTGKKATISAKAGGRISAFDGMVSGKLLQVVKNKMIVQTWRSKNWAKSSPDSIAVMLFEETPNGTKVSVVQSNVPDNKADAVKKGWSAMYFDAWKAHLEASAKPRKAAKKAPAKKAAKKKAPAKRAAKKAAPKKAAKKAPARRR